MARGNGRESISSELHTLVGVEFTEEVIHIGAEVRSNHVGEKKGLEVCRSSHDDE